MACRSISCYQFNPGVTTPTNGIIAGCTQSTTLAKILLHAVCQEAYETEISEALARGYPKGYATIFKTFVDDISSISRGHEEWVLQAQRNTSTILLQGLRNTKCKISKKTAVIATRSRLRIMHTKHLGRIGLKAKAPRVTRDLGLDYTGGNRRATGTIRKRIAQARARAHRVGQLNKVNKRARALYNTG
eukprot:8505154-Karenia_brevis.AAC.1